MSIEGQVIPFQKDHDITDPFLLNKSFKNVTFKPNNCRNHLQINNQAQIRLAPLLCSTDSINNICQKPLVTTDETGTLSSTVVVQFSAYNRLWFGAKKDYTGIGGVANRTGEATYELAVGAGGYNANVVQAVGAGNHEIYTAFGYLPKDLPTQYIKQNSTTKYFGDNFSGKINFIFHERISSDVDDSYYKSEPFTVNIPFPLNQTAIKETFTVPSIRTRQGTDGHYNYFIVNNTENNEDAKLLPIAPELFINAGVINESYNSGDFFAVPLGQYHGMLGGVLERNLFMFIPAFRVLKGNFRSSLARPRRFGDIYDAQWLHANHPWVAHNNFALPDLTAADNNHVAQRDFWAFFEETRGFQREDFEVPEYWDIQKVGHITIEPTFRRCIW